MGVNDDALGHLCLEYLKNVFWNGLFRVREYAAIFGLSAEQVHECGVLFRKQLRGPFKRGVSELPERADDRPILHVA